jgi:hypothetical protein
MDEQFIKIKLIKDRARIALLLVAYFDALKSSLSDHGEFFERVLRTHEEQKSDPQPPPPSEHTVR